MTHPPEALRKAVQALTNAATTPDIFAQATALLDRIAPMLIAGEREECAKVADRLGLSGSKIAMIIRDRGTI